MERRLILNDNMLLVIVPCWMLKLQTSPIRVITGEEVSIDKQVACEECPRWLKMTEVA